MKGVIILLEVSDGKFSQPRPLDSPEAPAGPRVPAGDQQPPPLGGAEEGDAPGGAGPPGDGGPLGLRTGPQALRGVALRLLRRDRGQLGPDGRGNQLVPRGAPRFPR